MQCKETANAIWAALPDISNKHDHNSAWEDKHVVSAPGSHLKTVGDEVRMGASPGQRPKLCDAYKARQVQDLALNVLAVAHAAQVEQLRAWARFKAGLRS